MKKIALFLVVALSAFGVAQMPNMEPPKQIKDMQWMHGNWASKMDWTMEGQTFPVEMTLKMETEGQFLKMTTVSKMMGMTMTEASYVSWNPETNKYRMWTFTNFAPQPRIENGEIKGDVWTMISEPWKVPGTPPTSSRATLTKKSNDQIEFLLEFKNGEKWDKVGAGSFKRVKS